MKIHTPEELTAAGTELLQFAETARANGRSRAADVLAIGADVCYQAAAAYATQNGIVRENADAAARIRVAGFFVGCVPAQDFDPAAECCLFTKEGICKACGWNTLQWTFHGRRFCCLTRFSSQASQALQDRAGALAPEPMP